MKRDRTGQTWAAGEEVFHVVGPARAKRTADGGALLFHPAVELTAGAADEMFELEGHELELLEADDLEGAAVSRWARLA